MKIIAPGIIYRAVYRSLTHIDNCNKAISKTAVLFQFVSRPFDINSNSCGGANWFNSGNCRTTFLINWNIVKELGISCGTKLVLFS